VWVIPLTGSDKDAVIVGTAHCAVQLNRMLSAGQNAVLSLQYIQLIVYMKHGSA